MLKIRPRIIFILLLQPLSLPASAQDLDIAQLTESDFFNEIPVVLTATRLKQSKKNSPIASTIIDREMIEASGFTEIADLLRLAPGMLVNYDSGHVANAGYQFLFDRYQVRLQILVDGKSVYTPLLGEMPWTQLGITIDDIERIEVIRGPSSASYGPNAMTGVISIITRHAALDKGTKFKLNQGVNGRSEQFATIGDSSGKFDYKLSLARRKDDGFAKRYDSKDVSVAYFRGDYQVTNNDVITISAEHSAGNYHDDAVDSLDANRPDHMKSVDQTSIQTKWEHNYSDGDIFTLNMYQQKYHDKNKYIHTASTWLLDETVNTERNNIDIAYGLVYGPHKLTLGALYRKDNTLAPEYLYKVNKDIHTQQVFLNSEININDANVMNIGILQDKNDTAGTSISPRISYNHHFNQNHTSRISYSESSRSPFAFEEYTNWVVNSGTYVVRSDLYDLKAEKIKSFDIGYVGNFNYNATNIDARIYKNWITDLIKLGSSSFVQGDAFNITGFEATLSHRVNNTRFILNYASTAIKPVNFLNKSYLNYATGAPDDTASLLITHDFNNKYTGAVGYYYTGSYQQLCCDDQLQSVRNRVDLTLSKSFKIDRYNSKLKFVLQNATNEVIDTRLFNNYERQGYISLSIEL